MMQHLIETSKSPLSGFYLHDFDKLFFNLKKAAAGDKKVLLLGVTFALLDFAEAYPHQLNNVIVMDTGGMKGRRKEMIREEVHAYLKKKWKIAAVASEYGMTELLSQAYALADGRFATPPWMKIILRDLNDPFDQTSRTSGGINIIDLANLHSCAFLQTADIGRLHAASGTFEVLGRSDNADVRGCNLMVV
jgi:hypothetical protein